MDHARCPYVEPKAPLPSYIKAALPNDVTAKIQQIQMDSNLNSEQKMERIDSIICDLPDTVIDQIPDPPRLAQLPAEVKQRVKQIERQHGKSFGTKFHEIMKYVDTLPDDTKSAAKGIFQ
ncbi:hypothetical protein GPALN_010428 [Globodera pallida]|uniref:FH2 domain-containing protein n=1 Tax=Globodera pallida TaxID=36090 RepID=A0A183CKZ8_GLOPA|nr:hypothetical protein GPALN_010428 [Globodera pallida]